MSATGQPSEEELRAAYEAEIKKIRVEEILLEQVVSIINLGMRRTGLAPGTEDERDIGQVRVAIEAVRALGPLLEQSAPAQAAQIRDALSQLQMAYVRLGGSPGGEAPAPGGEPAAPQPASASAASTDPGPAGVRPPAPAPSDPGSGPAGPGKPGDGGPAQRSGRLWIPGQ
jgi:hypothetical protein